MKTKRFLIFRNIFFILMALVLVGGLTATGLFAVPRHSPAELRVTNLVISSTEVHVGEQVAIIATVKNTGDDERSNDVKLKVDGDEVDKEKVTLGEGETRTVEFTLTIDVPGTYEIEVDGWKGTLNVIERPAGAEFRVTNLIISPAEVHVGEQTAIFAEVTNNGDSDGTHTIVLTLNNSNGEEVERSEAEVPVPAGETRIVEFTLTIDVPGTYEIEVDGLSGTLEVMERPAGAEFRVTNLAITPPTVEVGEMVIVSATIENFGQTDGTYIPTLKIDGTEIEEKPEVPVAAGGTATVEFTLAINVADTYEIEVDGEKGTLEVTAP